MVQRFRLESDTEYIYVNHIRSPFTCAAAVFGVGTVSALILLLVTGRSAVGSIACTAVLTGCMHGVNLMLISMLPPYFKKYGNVSTASGVLNACTYIGSAASTYGIAVISMDYGWNVTLWTWVGMAAGGLLLCLVCFRSFRSKIMSEAEQ